MQNTNSGIVYLDLDYTVQWSNIASVYGSIDGNTYQVGRKCYEGFGRTLPCSQCLISNAMSYDAPFDTVTDGHNGRKYEVMAIPIVEGDEIKGIMMKIEDRTEYYQLIDDLKEAQKKAETSDRLKSAFLANMSHEIRTPLNAIVGFSGLLSITEDEKEREEYNEIINTNNELLLQLIGDIIDLAKIEADAIDIYPVLFDFGLFFDQGFNSFAINNARKLNPNVKLISENLLPSCCYVELDKNRCLQIYTNFVSNALKYTREGTITVGCRYEQGGLLLYVEDTGIGIHQEDIPKLFNRFEKLNSFVQGTGLGLSICKALAEVIGGKVGVESEYGKGSRFWAWLPCQIQTVADIIDQ